MPTTLLLMVFYFVPFGYTLYDSLTNWDIASNSGRWVGLKNYARLWHGQGFQQALGHTVLYALGTIPASIGLGLLAALLLNAPIRGRGLYRTLYFAPVVAPMIASALVFAWLVSPFGGIVNDVLGLLGIQPINFLHNVHWAMIIVIIYSVWQVVGYNMVIYLAALQSIPRMYYDAARLDGANSFQVFRYLTWALIRPSTLFLTVIGVINALQMFNQVYILTGGGPLSSTTVLVYWLYQEAFTYFNGGLATAGSIVLFVIGALLTWLQFRFLARRQYDL